MGFFGKGIIIFTIIAVSIMICACGDSDSKDTSQPEEKQTIEVKRGDLTNTISAFGNVSMPHRANLSFGVGGTVKQLNVDFGVETSWRRPTRRSSKRDTTPS